MSEADEEALKAKDGGQLLNNFIRDNRRFILSCASKTAHRFITDSDDEWSIALSAFHEAVKSYDRQKGGFYAFAALVIKRRLLDYFDSEARHKNEIPTEPYAMDGQAEEEDDDYSLQTAVLKKSAEGQPENLISKDQPGISDMQAEIAAVQELLKVYGFSFFDLADCSPKAEKTKEGCAKAVAAILKTPELFEEMRRTKALPASRIRKISGVPRKILERHRKYIIAAAEILNGEYPLLKEYMNYIRKALAT